MFIGKKSHAALQWSEQGYHIELIWQQGLNKQTEHLNIELVNGDIRLDLKSNPHIQILASHPPCYVDIQQNTVVSYMVNIRQIFCTIFTDA